MQVLTSASIAQLVKALEYNLKVVSSNPEGGNLFLIPFWLDKCFMCVWERKRKKEGKECAQNQCTGQFEHSPHPLSLFLSLFLIQRSQNLSLILSFPIAQLVKAWRGVFFQAVLSSNPGQVKNLSFKDNCLDSEIFIAYQCWDWNRDLMDCNGEYSDWNFNPCKISKNPCIQ